MRKLEVGLALDRLLYPLRKCIAHPGDSSDVRYGRLTHRSDAPEPAKQGTLFRRAHAFDVIEDAPHGALGAHLLVIGHREAMRFVAEALHEVEALGSARKDDRVRPRGHEQLLTLLGQRRDRDLEKTGVGERRLAGRQLALA